jgi:hypothetical protein
VISDSAQARDDFESEDELTGSLGQIQLAAPEDDTNPGSEHDAAIVEAFIDTLARVAHAVASRQQDTHDQDE